MQLSDFATLQLAIVGVLVSVVTLLFATIVSKREEYRSTCKSIDLNLRNRALEVKKDIGKLKRFCSQLLIIIAVSFVLYIGCTVADNLLPENSICCATCIACVLTVSIFVWIIVLSFKVVKYFNDIEE